MRLKQTIHDLTGLVSFSLAAVWRARSAVWRTVRVSRLRHDPRPPPPPVGNLRTGKCFWNKCSLCTATRLRSLESFPSQILLLSHMSGFFFHTYRKCSSHFFGSDPVVPGPDQAGVKPLSDQIKVVFPKKTRHPVLMWNELKSQRNVTKKKKKKPRDHLMPSDLLIVSLSQYQFLCPPHVTFSLSLSL